MTQISVVIPTYNRQKKLQMVLSALEKQDLCLDDFEVVVVSDGSTDGTDDFLKNVSSSLTIRPVFQTNQGVAVARNQGTLQAQSDLILFIDDDVVAAPTLIREHLRMHQAEGDRVVVLGPMITPTGYKMSPWVAWEQMMLEKQYHAMLTGVYDASSRQFFTGNTSLRRQYLLDVGGFDPSFRRAEDVELAHRLSRSGMRFVFNPQAIGYHYAERSYQSWSDTAYVYGKNDVIFSLQKQHRWILPAVFTEFYERHGFTQTLTRLCLDRPQLQNPTISALKTSALLLHPLGLKKLSSVILSGIFNLRYYQGVSDQLGGRKTFFAGVRLGDYPPSEAPLKEGKLP